MPTIFESVILFIDRIGFTQVVLPFILVFTLVFAFLEKTKVLGQENGQPKTRFNAMVSFVIAFFVLIMADVLKVINVLAQYIVLIVIGALMLAVILGILGVKKKANVVKIAALVVVLLAGVYAIGIDLQPLMPYVVTPAIGIIAFALVIYYVLRGKPKPKGKPEPVPPPEPSH